MNTKVKEYLPLTSDIMFYEMFGREDSKGAMAYILSEYSGDDYDYIFNNMEYLDPRPPITSAKYSYRFHTDIIVKVVDKVYNVECNAYHNDGLLNRNLGYLFGLFASQFRKGDKEEDFEEAKTHIQININAYEIEESKKRKGKHYLIGEDGMLTNVIEIGMLYLDLSKNKKYNKVTEGVTPIEKISRLLQSRNREDLDFMENQELADQIADKANSLSEDDGVYFKWISQEQEEIIFKKSFLHQGIEEGMAEGLERGTKIGMEKNKVDIAKKMLEEKIDIDLISKVTGLTKEEIEKISN